MTTATVAPTTTPMTNADLPRPTAPGQSGVRSALVGLCYCASWSAFLSSWAIEVPVDPVFPVAFLVVSQFALGRFGESSWLLALSAFPPLFPLLFPGAIPPEPDIPGYPTLVATLLIFPVMPIGLVVSWLGLRLRRRVLRRAREG